MPTSNYSDVNLHQTILLFVLVWSDRSVLLKKKKGSNTCIFLGCMESVRCRQPISTNASGESYSIRLVPLFFGGGLRHAITDRSYSSLSFYVLAFLVGCGASPLRGVGVGFEEPRLRVMLWLSSFVESGFHEFPIFLHS